MTVGEFITQYGVNRSEWDKLRLHLLSQRMVRFEQATNPNRFFAKPAAGGKEGK